MPQYIPLQLRYIIKIYLSGIAVFTIFRILLIIIQHEQLNGVSWSLIMQAMIMGWRYDTVVSFYILAFPVLLVIINLLANKNFIFLNRINTIFTIIFYSLAFLICCIDIPYFNHYLTRVTYSILNWSNNPMFMFKLVFQEVKKIRRMPIY